MSNNFANLIEKNILDLKDENEINKFLMEFLKENLKLWEQKLKPLCKINNVSYYREIVKILEKSGFNNLNEKKIETYIRRIK